MAVMDPNYTKCFIKKGLEFDNDKISLRRVTPIKAHFTNVGFGHHGIVDINQSKFP
jgi:hypothetical protein